MKSASEIFRAGLTLLQQGEVRRAADLAAEALEEYPDDGPLWELLGVAEQRDGQHIAAREALETASLLKPLDIGARFCLAEAFAATGLAELAVFVYRMVSDDARTPIWLLPRVASQLGQMQAYSDALHVCRTILSRDATRHEAHFGVGFYLRRLDGDPAEVLSAIGRAHEMAPRVSLYRVVLASLLQEAGQHEEAYDLLQNLPPELIGCPESLRRMMTVFRTAKDLDRILNCARCLRDLDLRNTNSQSEHCGEGEV